MANIIILEPDRILASQLGKFFERKGHKIALCQDAQSAIMAADKNLPDLVVMEMLLAGHSGAEFLYEFRSYSEWLDIPVVIYSRVQPAELNLGPKAVKDLNISAILYKSTASLDKLMTNVEKVLDLANKA